MDHKEFVVLVSGELDLDRYGIVLDDGTLTAEEMESEGALEDGYGIGK